MLCHAICHAILKWLQCYMAQWHIFARLYRWNNPLWPYFYYVMRKKLFHHYINKGVAYNAVIYVLNTCAIILQERLLSNKYLTESRTMEINECVWMNKCLWLYSVDGQFIWWQLIPSLNVGDWSAHVMWCYGFWYSVFRQNAILIQICSFTPQNKLKQIRIHWNWLQYILSSNMAFYTSPVMDWKRLI